MTKAIVSLREKGIDHLANILAKAIMTLPEEQEIYIVETIGNEELSFHWNLFGDEYTSPNNMLDLIEERANNICDVMMSAVKSDEYGWADTE